MDSKKKIHKVQEELLNEIEEERKFIEKNTESLQGKSKNTSLKKKRLHPTRAKKTLFARHIKKFLKPPKGLK